MKNLATMQDSKTKKWTMTYTCPKCEEKVETSADTAFFSCSGYVDTDCQACGERLCFAPDDGGCPPPMYPPMK